MPKENNLFNIPGVEIFAAGKWNGDTYTTEDLDEIVKAFSETSDRIKPYLKLGHNDGQKLVQTDGLPAAGWIGSIYRQGQKLLADFVDIPDKIYKLIENKAYRKVSSEIYFDINIEGKKYKRLLSAVSLLGANMPAVTCLNDILGLYTKINYDSLKAYTKDDEEIILKVYDYDQGDDQMPETKPIDKVEKVITDEVIIDETQEETKELETQKESTEVEKTADDTHAEIDALKADFEKKLEEKDAEIEELKKFKADSDAKALEVENELFIKELGVSPAMKPYIIALISTEKKEYSIDNKNLSKKDIVKELFSLKETLDVNLEESSDEGEKGGDLSEDVINGKIEAYMDEHKCKYSTAYVAVCKQNNDMAEDIEISEDE